MIALKMSRRWAGIMLLTAATFGCQTTEKTLVTSSEVRGHYQAGRYRQAYEQAVKLERQTVGGQRDEARFVAGMSAYRIGESTAAIRYLKPLVSNASKSMAGSSNATLGLMHSDRGEHDRAIAYFKHATELLEGEDLAHAYYHLGITEQKVGRYPEARAHLSLAINKSQDSEFQRIARQRLNATGYTLQLGAYTEQRNADARAAAVRAAAAQAGLSSPRVVSSKNADGSAMFLVQTGQYSTYDAAAKARGRLKDSNVVIVPMTASP